jgi:hypothetical protein
VKPDETEKVNMPDEWDSDGSSKPAAGDTNDESSAPSEDTGDGEEK